MMRQPAMRLNRYHRELLAMRTYLNKFGIEVGYRGSPGLIQALDELIAEGYVIKIDSNFFHQEIGRILDIYQLTKKGIQLCKEHNIVATNP